MENRPGGTGLVATEAVARSPRDGYTAMLCQIASHAITPARSKLSFDHIRDFSFISMVGILPNVFERLVNVPSVVGGGLLVGGPFGVEVCKRFHRDDFLLGLALGDQILDAVARLHQHFAELGDIFFAGKRTMANYDLGAVVRDFQHRIGGTDHAAHVAAIGEIDVLIALVVIYSGLTACRCGDKLPVRERGKFPGCQGTKLTVKQTSSNFSAPAGTNDASLSTRQRTDYSDWRVIAVGMISIVIMISVVPVFWMLLPFAVVALIVLYLVAGNSLKKARALAKSRLGPTAVSSLQVDFSPGLASALELNDWGVVFVRKGKRSIAIPWQDIRLVEEPKLAALVFHHGRAESFEVDLSQDRYFLATKSIFSKIPERTKFLIDPESGQSELLRKLEREPYRWQGKWGHFSTTREGVEHSKGNMPWGAIESVVETMYETEDGLTDWKLAFKSSTVSFALSSLALGDTRGVGNNDYDLIKAIVHERISNKVHCEYPPSDPINRAKDEFNRYYEAAAAAFSFAVKSGKWTRIENLFQHNLWLLDTFSVHHKVEAKKFLQDYAELLSRTNRTDESSKMLERANALLW